MAVEVEHYRYQNEKDFPLKTLVVLPGTFERIDFFEPLIKLWVFCGVENLTTIIIEEQKRKALRDLYGVMYDDENDHQGQWIDLSSGQVSLRSPQELSIEQTKKRFLRKRVTEKQIVIYLPNDNNDVYDELPTESKPLVLV